MRAVVMATQALMLLFYFEAREGDSREQAKSTGMVVGREVGGATEANR